MRRRWLFLIPALAFLHAVPARADATISGQWRAYLGHEVLINMDILADGHWFSETIQNDKVVAEMAGTYEQTPKDDANGTIVFTPVKSKVTAEHGEAKIETDTYSLINGGRTLVLNAKSKNEMRFNNTTSKE